MHININITGQWLLLAVIVAFIFWGVYRLVKRYIRRCPCGAWLGVKRIKFMELDPIAPSDKFFGQMYFVYILGICNKCECVHVYKVYRRRFSGIELWWRRNFHPGEFNRPDSQILIEMAGIDLRGHSSEERFGHKPQLHVEPPIETTSVHTATEIFANHTIEPVYRWGDKAGSKG